MQFLFFWPKKYFAFENWESLIQHHHFRRPFLTNSGDATLPTPVTSLPLTERVNVHLNFFFFFSVYDFGSICFCYWNQRCEIPPLHFNSLSLRFHFANPERSLSLNRSVQIHIQFRRIFFTRIHSSSMHYVTSFSSKVSLK